MLMTARLPNWERVVIWGQDIRDRWKLGAHPDKCNQVLWLPEFVKLTTASPPGSTQVKWWKNMKSGAAKNGDVFAQEGIIIRTFAIISKTQVELKSKPNWSSWRVGSTIQAAAGRSLGQICKSLWTALKKHANFSRTRISRRLSANAAPCN